MNSSHLEKNKVSKKKKTAIKVHVGMRINIKLFQRIILGTCYVAGVIGIGLILTLTVVTWPQPLEKILLIQEASSNSVTLTWTAPGDDNNTGQADKYEIRYADFKITAANWASATQVPNPSNPKIAGSKETFEITGLEPDTLYYFAIKTADEVPNWSPISNVVSKRTAPIYSCVPDWSCTDWTKCQDGEKYRFCIDQNNCGNNSKKPVTRRECTVIPEPEPTPTPVPEPEPEICREKWSCTDWTDCLKGYQRRECADVNKCATEKNRPKEVIECAIGGAEPDFPQEHYLAVTPSSHGGPHLKLYDENLNLYSQFFTYAPEFRSGVNPAIGDIEGDGGPEIIVGTGPGSAPHLRVFDKNGALKYQFYAFPPEYRIGISVTAGDVDGDGRDEIITAPQEKGGPHIRVFKYQPDEGKLVLFQQFFAYPSYFRMGVNVASGDLNNDSLAEIIIAPRNRGGPHVRIFQLDPVTREFNMQHQFFAYDFGFRGGVSLAVGDIDNDGINEIIAGAGPGGGPHVRIFDNRGSLKYQFFAASNRFRGGLDVAALDYDHDGGKEVVTCTYSSGLPGVKIFKKKQDNLFEEKEFFFVYDPSYQWGIRVAGY